MHIIEAIIQQVFLFIAPATLAMDFLYFNIFEIALSPTPSPTTTQMLQSSERIACEKHIIDAVVQQVFLFVFMALKVKPPTISWT